jgi:hypothetical protein
MDFKELVEKAEANKKEHFKRVIEENKRKIAAKREKEIAHEDKHN